MEKELQSLSEGSQRLTAAIRSVSAKRILLITGAPGVGKTTLVRGLARALAARRLAGFTTDEIREKGRRVGFRIVPFGGAPRVMAHVRFPGPRRVGRYGVDVASIDAVAQRSLVLDPAIELYLVDEIGKMECFSERFVAAMRVLLDSRVPVVATIAKGGGGFIAEVKRRGDVELWEVTAANRQGVAASILAWLGFG